MSMADMMDALLFLSHKFALGNTWGSSHGGVSISYCSDGLALFFFLISEQPTVFIEMVKRNIRKKSIKNKTYLEQGMISGYISSIWMPNQ